MTDPDRDRLRARLAEAGYTPGRRDVAPLVALIDDGELAPTLRRALARAPAEVVTRAIAAALAGAADATGAALATVLADAAARDPDARAALIATLADPRPRTQRAAVVGLGKVGGDDARAALCALWDRPELAPPLRRAVADALGKVGGDDARARLAAAADDGDPELVRRRARALLISERDADARASTLVLDRAPATPVIVVGHCRAGLEPLLAAELDEAGVLPLRLGPGRVMALLGGPLAQVAEVRIALAIGILRPLAKATAEAIADALAADEVGALLAAWTEGAIRWRLDFARGGHRRALVWATAAAVRARTPALQNQPRDATWDVVIGADEHHLELRPRALGDARFAWRVTDIPAASHPTIAAALARVAAPTADTTAWDPFVGSGGELCELARLTDGALHGSDLDERSLAAATANLTAAGVAARATLTLADALTHAPPPVDVIVTNPPMGMRLRGDVGALLAEFAARVPARLTARGRLVWLTPAASRTGPPLARAGLRRTYARPVDLGGHEVMLERWDR
ncbi:MAG: HEAT repeat domain-containing protein [Myxococcales bacterium]|nr:HEAT repeat domain-containing protein [Myxococcales bacterium]